MCTYANVDKINKVETCPQLASVPAFEQSLCIGYTGLRIVGTLRYRYDYPTLCVFSLTFVVGCRHDFRLCLEQLKS